MRPASLQERRPREAYSKDFFVKPRRPRVITSVTSLCCPGLFPKTYKEAAEHVTLAGGLSEERASPWKSWGQAQGKLPLSSPAWTTEWLLPSDVLYTSLQVAMDSDPCLRCDSPHLSTVLEVALASTSHLNLIPGWSSLFAFPHLHMVLWASQTEKPCPAGKR